MKEAMISPALVCVFLSVCNQYNWKQYEWIFTKLYVTDHHQNVTSAKVVEGGYVFTSVCLYVRQSSGYFEVLGGNLWESLWMIAIRVSPWSFILRALPGPWSEQYMYWEALCIKILWSKIKCESKFEHIGVAMVCGLLITLLYPVTLLNITPYSPQSHLSLHTYYCKTLHVQETLWIIPVYTWDQEKNTLACHSVLCTFILLVVYWTNVI